MTQRTKFKTVVYILLFIIACVLLFWFSSRMSAKVRDYQRLGDLKVAQAKMTSYFQKYNTYKIPDCEKVPLNRCSAGLADFAQLRDPINSGIYIYQIHSLSENDYQIVFALETQMAGLKAGGHVYGKEGIIK